LHCANLTIDVHTTRQPKRSARRSQVEARLETEIQYSLLIVHRCRKALMVYSTRRPVLEHLSIPDLLDFRAVVEVKDNAEAVHTEPVLATRVKAVYNNSDVHDIPSRPCCANHVI